MKKKKKSKKKKGRRKKQAQLHLPAIHPIKKKKEDTPPQSPSLVSIGRAVSEGRKRKTGSINRRASVSEVSTTTAV